MIKIDLLWGIAIIFVLYLVCTAVIFYNLGNRREEKFFLVKDLCQCPICMYVFFVVVEDQAVRCPQCKSIDYVTGQTHVKTIKE